MSESDLIKKFSKTQSSFIFNEVSIGDKTIFGKNSTDRKIDIVIFHKIKNRQYLNYSENKDRFNILLQETRNDIEIIEVKIKLNRNVIGQILVGEFMFKEKYKVKKLKKSILYSVGDEALELFCKKNQINLIRIVQP